MVLPPALRMLLPGLALLLAGGVAGAGPDPAAAEPPTAIVHAFNEPFRAVTAEVCRFARDGYSHVLITPAQVSSPGPEWWRRYQPVDLGRIGGRGSAADLRALTRRAHGCGLRVIADVVINHMSSHPAYRSLRFPGLGPADVHPRCAIDYNDGNTVSERRCWLNGDLPDLDPSRPAVARLQRAQLRQLLGLGVDGFRFDAAKHMEPSDLGSLVAHVQRLSGGRSWILLEVIDDHDTRPEMYTAIAPVTDYILCDTLRGAFAYDGQLSSLRLPRAIPDRRSVTFGLSHDSDPAINPGFGRCQPSDRHDGVLATAYVLARTDGTPLVLAADHRRSALLQAGARFRASLRARARAGADTREWVPAIGDPRNLLLMERGREGFFVVNKAATPLRITAAELAGGQLRGRYRNLRGGETLVIGGRNSRDLTVPARDGIYFLRDPDGA